MTRVGAALLALLAAGLIAWAAWAPDPGPRPRPAVPTIPAPVRTAIPARWHAPPTYPYGVRRPTATPTRSTLP